MNESIDPQTQGQEIDYGDGYAGTEAKEPGDFPVLPRSKRTVTRNPDGSKTSDYNPKYLCELQQTGKIVTPDFPGATPRFKLILRSVNPIPGAKTKGVVFFEFPVRVGGGEGGFLTPEQIAARVDSDIAAGAQYTRKAEFVRETAIEKKGNFQQRQKATVESLTGVLGGQSPLILRDPAMVGAKFAVAVDHYEQSDGQINAVAIKFFAANRATDFAG